ncbi:MAG: nitrite reductase small subunit NirD [Cytophagaceae bacterium]
MLTITKKETWIATSKTSEFPQNGGACIKYKDHQIAIFNFTRRNEWYATDNLCPHKHQMILSRGMVGDTCGEPKVTCPFHKKNFSLKTGANLNGEDYCIKTYPVKVEEGMVYIDVSSLEPGE